MMQLLFGKRELARRKQSTAAKALSKMPQLDCSFDRSEMESLQPLFLPDGAIYQGLSSFEGKIEGFGVSYNADGSIYEGEWKNGLYSGIGRLVFAEDHMYEGEFKEGKFEGEGIYWLEGFRYKGQWLLGYAHGAGLEVNEGKFSYEGEYIRGVKTGKGTMKFYKEGTYVGDFRENDLEGFGIRSWSDRLYTGYWHQGQMHGEGTLSYISGERYEGGFVNDMKNGAGSLQFKSGEIFVGNWMNDQIAGPGELTLREGEVKIGTWTLEELKRTVYKK